MCQCLWAEWESSDGPGGDVGSRTSLRTEPCGPAAGPGEQLSAMAKGTESGQQSDFEVKRCSPGVRGREGRLNDHPRVLSLLLLTMFLSGSELGPPWCTPEPTLRKSVFSVEQCFRLFFFFLVLLLKSLVNHLYTHLI